MVTFIVLYLFGVSVAWSQLVISRGNLEYWRRGNVTIWWKALLSWFYVINFVLRLLAEALWLFIDFIREILRRGL